MDSQKFAAIVRYYRETCPAAKFDGRQPTVSDGPRGERLHINVPLAVEAEHLHPFSPEFLKQKSNSADGLNRMIAEHLSYLRYKRLFTRSGTIIGCDGNGFECTTYVVEDEMKLKR